MSDRCLRLVDELAHCLEALTPGERIEIETKIAKSVTPGLMTAGLAAGIVANARTRERLEPERRSVTKAWRLAYEREDGTTSIMKFYFIASAYPDGRPGEVFVKADKAGSTVSGALDGAAIMISLLLQHGVPLTAITSKLRGTRFAPAGFTKDPAIPSCTSPLDLLAQWLDLTFSKPAGVES